MTQRVSPHKITHINFNYIYYEPTPDMLRPLLAHAWFFSHYFVVASELITKTDQVSQSIYEEVYDFD